MNGLILASGVATRWNGVEYPKQLIVYKDEYLVRRTARMLSERGLEPIIVTHDPRIAEGAACEAFEPRNYRFTLETLLSTRELWGDGAIVTLGDVLYSAGAMNRLLETRYLAVGSPFEVFGLNIKKTGFLGVERLASRAIAVCERTQKPKYGKLGTLVKLYGGMDVTSTLVEVIGLSMEDVRDGFIRDFDSYEALESFHWELDKGLIEPV